MNGIVKILLLDPARLALLASAVSAYVENTEDGEYSTPEEFATATALMHELDAVYQQLAEVGP